MGSQRSRADTPVAASRTVRAWIGLAVIGLSVAVIVVRFTRLWPTGAAGGYLVSLLSEAGSDGLTVLLLAVLLLRSARPRSAERLLLLGAAVLALAVVYRLGIAVLDELAAANQPMFALPAGPALDPVVMTGSGATGAWLLALGIARLPGTHWRWPSLRGIPVLAVGVVVVALVTASAALVGWFPEARLAVLISALGALGWTALALAALDGAGPTGGQWLVGSGGMLTLASVGLNALDLLAQRWPGPLRDWLPGLLQWHDAYIYVDALGFLAWVALCVGFLASTAPVRTRGASTWGELRP